MPGKATLNFGEAVRIATASLWAHKLRSALTLLGVVIGVMSVIAVVSIVNGLNSYVAEKIFNLGADVILISRGPLIVTNIDQMQATQKRRKFRMDDYIALRDSCQSCVAVGADVSTAAGQVKYGTQYISNTRVFGWSAEMPQLYNFDLAEGRHINRADMASAAPVCTIGFDIADKLLPGLDPIGRELRVDTTDCFVIGVTKKLGSVLGQSRDNLLIMPLSTYQKTYGSDDSLILWVKSNGTKAMEATTDEVRLLLRARRHVPYAGADDFDIETNASFLSLWGSISSAFFVVIIAIASISLVVGGIVIMNIMLVSVTERTHEIGLRKSLGARQSDIRLQFLIESSTIAAIGGAWGVALGILLAKFVTLITSLPSSIQLWSVLLGLAVATSVGLFFGVYPASKAARLDPVVALRAE